MAWSYGLLERLVESRERDMAGEPPADLPALLDYADGSSATLALLALRVLGPAQPGGRRGRAQPGYCLGLDRDRQGGSLSRRPAPPLSTGGPDGQSRSIGGTPVRKGFFAGAPPRRGGLGRRARRRLAAVRRTGARLPRRYHPCSFRRPWPQAISGAWKRPPTTPSMPGFSGRRRGGSGASLGDG